MVPEKFGRYEVLGLLGERSMGRVYRAFDPLGHRNVAIKTIRPEFLSADTAGEYLRRFRREAQAAGALSHPSIITIFDVGEDYFVMELLEGATLQAVLRERGALDLPEALRLLGAIAAGLDFAHEKGVIHRDVKPGNLMILPDGRTKIMDFGVAHLAAKEMSVSGQFLGSPAYMAPERILRGEATPSSDLFSFAVVAYESLTGWKPFDGDSVSDVVAAVVKGEPRAPRSINPALPATHDQVFAHALAKDPAARYPSAAAFLDALGEGQAEPAPALVLPASSGARDTSMASSTIADTAGRPAPPASWWRPGRLLAGGAPILLLSMIAGYSARRPAPASSASPKAAMAGLAVPGLSVETVPPGAQVVLDGVERGDSPLSLAGLTPGPHTVRVLREGYSETELSLELSLGMGEVPLRLTLQPLKFETGERADAAALPRAVASPEPRRPSAAPVVAESSVPTPEPSTAPHASEPPPSAERVETVARASEDLQPPVRISGDPPRYPDLARALRLRGSVTVEMTVTETGEPDDLRVLQSASPILEKAALEAVRTWRFEPARRSGAGVRYAGHRVTLSFEP